MSQLNFETSPGAAPAAGPMQQSAAAPAVQKQHLNVYTMMLLISAIALMIGGIVLYMEVSKFGSYPWWKVDEARITGFLHEAPQMFRSAVATLTSWRS